MNTGQFGRIQSLGSHESEETRKRRAEKINYSEKRDDADFESMLRQQEAARIQRQKSDPSKAQAPPPVTLLPHGQEAETAWAVDLNAMGLVEEEEDILPPGASESAYVQMRNHVLTKWRADVSRYLSEDEAEQGLPDSFKRYARIAWRFLDTMGFINFGVSPEILARCEVHKHSKGTVVVVGAGLAGSAAAIQLRKSGFRVLVLEGHDRPGGRVHTKKLQGGGIEAAADLGGSIITGIDGNPLAVLAKQLKIPMHDIEAVQVPLYLADGSTPPKDIDEEVEQDWNKMLDKCSDLRDISSWSTGITDNISLEACMKHYWHERRQSRASPSDDEAEEELKERLFRWHIANCEFASAAEVKDLSVRSWDQDDPHELPGAHSFLPGGNARIIAALVEHLDVMYNARVKKISYCQKGVQVNLSTCTIKCDAVLVTESLGCLKAGNIQYKPPLPLRKQEAIKRIGFGLLNKIILLFSHNFWGSDDMFGRLPEIDEDRGEYYLFYSYADISGGPVLTALVSGAAAEPFEQQSLEVSTAKVMAILRSIFTAKNILVPDPLQVVGTRWGSDPLARGSYSSMAVGVLGGEDYDILAESVCDRVFFAGEATTKNFPATMHGAFSTGLREAVNISKTLGMLEERRQAAALRHNNSKPDLPVSRPLDEAELRNSASISKAAIDLVKLFRKGKVTPDVEFGCFSAFYVPPDKEDGEGEGSAVMRVDINAAKGRNSAKYTDILLLLSRTSLMRLQDVNGGDEARFALLGSLSDVKLVGRPGPAEKELQCLQRAADWHNTRQTKAAQKGRDKHSFGHRTGHGQANKSNKRAGQWLSQGLPGVPPTFPPPPQPAPSWLSYSQP